MLAKNEEINELLDWYSALLTVKQIDIMNLYYREDLSLMEIAENLQISRSAVYDLLKRTVNSLHNYEKRLNLVKNYKMRLVIYRQLDEIDCQEVKELTKKLQELE
ncbi:hypothetical protein SDC9_195072 [bioreactor metagenome]|uniref:Uncharacterized protein n=1 Tax=bioreactor metagenome TaxID=1076179 RepID=A0A645I8L9_9ZZZZ|nr:sigma factor-like helix-turn-helix DNA-binding protein [Erysipelotrichaceae bacterium]